MKTMTVQEYEAAVDAGLGTEYGITWRDVSGHWPEIAGAMNANVAPADFVEWFATKYNLTPLSEIML